MTDEQRAAAIRRVLEAWDMVVQGQVYMRRQVAQMDKALNALLDEKGTYPTDEESVDF